MNNNSAVRLIAAALALTAALPAAAQLSVQQTVALDSIRAGIRRTADDGAERARARARDRKLAGIFAAAPEITNPAALNDSWIMAEPGYSGGLRIDALIAKPAYPAHNGIDLSATSAVSVSRGTAFFTFAAAASTTPDNDMDMREDPVHTTEAAYQCRLLANPELMICRVSFVPWHYDNAAAPREERYEGFQRQSYTPFR